MIGESSIFNTQEAFEAKLTEPERKIESHDKSIQAVFDAIRKLMKPPETPKRKIGFDIKEKQALYGKCRNQHS